MKYLILLSAIILISCKTSYIESQSYDSPISPTSKSKSFLAFNKPEEVQTQQSERKDNVQRKTYFEAYLTLEVSDVDATINNLKESIKGYDAYMVSSSQFGITFRIKSEQFDEYLKIIPKYGDVVKKNITGQDVTDQYEDLIIQIENAQEARNRYLKLLEKAVTVEEILKIEKELERITDKIELLEGRKNRLDNIIAYSLVNITVVKEVTPGPLGWIFVGLWKGISWLFVWD